MSLHGGDWAKLLGALAVTYMTGGAGAPLIGAALGGAKGGSKGAVNGALGGSLAGLTGGLAGGASGGASAAGTGFSDLLKSSAVNAGTGAAMSALTPQHGMTMPGQVPQLQQDDPMIALQKLMEQSKRGGRI